jgi:hypothetical protein
MTFQSITKFLPDLRWVLGSLLFIADMFGDLNLQELESCVITGSGTRCLPPTVVWVGLINEAQLEHGPVKLGKMDTDPSGDKVDHTLVVLAAITDPIYQLPLESDSEDNWEVFMVGEGEQPPRKTAEEIAQEIEEEIAQATRLAKEARTGKRHNGL